MSTTPTIGKRARKAPIEQILLPFQEFLRAEAAGGILLLVCTVVALAWANSAWSDAYTALWRTRLTLSLGDFALDKPLFLWINDGLMAIFFFVVGLEIKREVLVGELRSVRQATLPIAAALGGMAVPAIFYAAMNTGRPGSAGWGIPMATDIAFALGILALLGKRAPLSLKVFLTALAIVDDIGAVLVIALFYTAEISYVNLALGGGFLIALVAANRAGVRHPLVYAVLSFGLWAAFLKSGVHATVAGVLAAMTIPARTRINSGEFLARGRFLLQKFEEAAAPGEGVLTNHRQRAAVQALETACQNAESPMQRLEHGLHPWVAWVIMPLFALANAGVSPGGELFTALADPVALGIIAGLVAGKQVGITLFAWLAVRARLAVLPEGLTWRHIYGVSWLGGIGFTMSLFIGGLAFGDTPLLTVAKVGILCASLVAGLVGWLLLRRTAPFTIDILEYKEV